MVEATSHFKLFPTYKVFGHIDMLSIASKDASATRATHHHDKCENASRTRYHQRNTGYGRMCTAVTVPLQQGQHASATWVTKPMQWWQQCNHDDGYNASMTRVTCNIGKDAKDKDMSAQGGW